MHQFENQEMLSLPISSFILNIVSFDLALIFEEKLYTDHRYRLKA